MFDTERLELESWGHVGKELKCPFDAKEVAMKSVGLNKKETERVFKSYFGKTIDFSTFRNMCMKRLRECIEQDGLPIKKGLIELLTYLRDNNFKMTVATSSERERLEYYFKKAKVSQFFDKVVCDDMIQNGKPAPDIYLRAIEILQVPAGECIALEDSPAGVLAASRAGLRPVMIPDLIRPNKETREIMFAELNSLLDVIEMLKAQ